jgi:hypothetical protein
MKCKYELRLILTGERKCLHPLITEINRLTDCKCEKVDGCPNFKPVEVVTMAGEGI